MKKSLSDNVCTDAKSCKNCKQECMKFNHLGIDIPRIFQLIRQGKSLDAQNLLLAEDPLPAVTSRIGLTKSEEHCPYHLRIRAMIQELAELPRTISKPRKKSTSVAIIGAGLAGLSTAQLLVAKGLNVHVYESQAVMGGSLRFLVAEHSLPRGILDNEINRVAASIEFHPNTLVGVTIGLDELAGKYDLLVVATGANKPLFPGIPGEHLPQVHTVGDVLVHGVPTGEGTAVVLGGNRASLDAAVLFRQANYETIFAYPKQVEELPCSYTKVREAQRGGVQFLPLTDVVRIDGNPHVTSVECRHLMYGDSDESGERATTPIEDSEFSLPCNHVVLGVGFEPNQSMRLYTKLRTVGKGRLWVNEHMQTTIPNVFACGEIVLGHTSVDHVLKSVKTCV